MLNKLKIKYQSDAKFRQRAKLLGAGSGVMVVLYLIAEFVIVPVPDRPRVSYNVEVDALINNQADNPFEQEGVAARVNELKEMYRRGTSEHDQRIADLEKKLTSQVQENRNLESRFESVQTETRDDFADRFEILAQQFEKRLMAPGESGLDGPRVADLKDMANWKVDNTNVPDDPADGAAVPDQQSADSSYAEMMNEWAQERAMAQSNGDSAFPSPANSRPSPQGIPGPGQNLQQGKDQSAPPLLAVNIVNGSGRFMLSDSGTVVAASAPEKTDDNDGPQTSKREGATVVTSREEQERMAPDKQKDKGAYMPAGSLIGGILMTGVDAPTDKSAEAEPYPVLIRVKREAILPSRFRLDIRECFIIGEAHAKLNTSRAYIRANRISCIRSDGGVIETKIKAYAVDTDSKIGLTGQIVSRQGTVIARSIMAGFLSGLSQAFTPTQVPVIIDSTDGNQVFQSASAGDVGAVAGYNGLATAAEKVSDYYLKIAEDLYPVVELNAGRKIDLILLQGIALDVRG